MLGTEKSPRNTRQRQTILEALRRVSTHPTAAEIYAMVRRDLPQISLGTVYRNLDFLWRQGSIRKIDMGHEQARFDADTSRHHHIRCIECKRVDDIFELPEELTLGTVASLSGYRVLEVNLDIVGICAACLARY
jgi:Fur family ferric uptake transcriptional regulator